MNSDTPPIPTLTKPELRTLMRQFFDSPNGELKAKITALRNEDIAWIAAQNEFKTFIIATQTLAALGLCQMTKTQQRAQDWFIRASTKAAEKERNKKRAPKGIPEVVPAEALNE
jgi:hypothetical protein